MSERVLRILLSELSTVRVVCKYCKTAVETTLEEIRKQAQPAACPMCQRPLNKGSLPMPLHDLAAAIRVVNNAPEYAVELVVIAPDQKP